jgi:cell wall-associated NlpC family hydrolase
MEIPSVSGLFEARLGALRSRLSGNLQSYSESFTSQLETALEETQTQESSALQELTIVPAADAQASQSTAQAAQESSVSGVDGGTQAAVQAVAATQDTAVQARQISIPPRILYTSAASVSSSQSMPLYIPKAQATKLYAQCLGVSGEALGVVETAKQYVGIPYVRGGVSLETGADCSGFVYAVYKKCGIKIPRSAYGQLKTGTEVSPENMQPGDLLIFTHDGHSPDHVAMYIGDGKIIEAKGVKYGVCITNLGNNWVERKHLLSIRRMVSE